MKRIVYKKHKVLLYFLRKLFLRGVCSKKFVKILKIKGLFFDIRGKVGVSGNAKKRHFSFVWGKTSLTTKLLRVKLDHGLARTHTGVLGITFSINY